MFFEFDDFDVRERFFTLEEKAQKLNHLLDNKSPEFRERFQEVCTQAYVLHDSALDGQVITGEDVRLAFSSRVYPATFKNRLMQEIKNHRRLFSQMCLSYKVNKLDRVSDKVYRSRRVSFDDVVQLHNELYENIGQRDKGQFRRIIPLHGTYFHDLAEPSKIRSQLQALCRQTEHPDFIAQHPINQAVMFHSQFMSIFPFSIGSGKIGRLYMNSFLRQGGYASAIIHGSERQGYYEALKEGKESLRAFLLDSMDSALDSQIKHIYDLA